ncbi:hypothetical protein J2Y74_003670 [Pseudomonas migulae]|uniref:hypothetical protein n=1 Tax=Pseudomonas migulae TaxID=78543 RepID=UPI00209FF1DA|nr:hypothetical protein [Pseudomonas migulae]MCP1519360.1 hypothetical protein [Pseudomonas migulae]
MDTVRWQTINSSIAELEINYGEKWAKIRLENLAIPDDAKSEAKAFYLERLKELFAAINAESVHWTDRPSE